MKQTPITLALAFAGALSFAAAAGAQTGTGQTGTAGGAGTGQTGTTGQGGTDVGSGGQGGVTGQTGSSGDIGGQSGSAMHQSSSSDKNKDHEFVQKAAIGNLAEIQLSQMALQRSQDPQVKQFAQMMVDQHTQAQNQLQQAASAAGFSLPTELDSKHQKMAEKLSGKNGEDFDREYAKLMVASHKESEDLLKKKAGKSASANTSASTSGSGISGSASGTAGTTGSTTGTSGSTATTGSATGTTGSTASSGTVTAGGDVDAQVISYATTILPQVQQHLQEAKQLEKQVKNQNKGNDNASKRDHDKGGK